MAFQQNFGGLSTNLGSNGNASNKQKWNSLSPSATVPENLNGCFDCNICLDTSHDPVVTPCGHLYCWPCIYKWLQIQSSSFESDEQSKCPVCKSYVSTSLLVPLYGRGTSESETKKPPLDLAVPNRPPAPGLHAMLAAAATSRTSHLNQRNHLNPFQPHHQAFHPEQYFPHLFGNYTSMVHPTFGGASTTSFYSPTVNMVGEMVFSRMFGRSSTSLFAHPYSNPYPILGNGSPRSRRQEIQLDESLNRVCIFLFCCIIFCLILFYDIIDSLDPLLVQLLLKSSQDKKFVCEAAESALIALTSSVSPLLLLPKLQPHIKNRNPRIRAKASMCISWSVPRMGADEIEAFGIDKLIQVGASQLSDQLPESRDAARTLLLELQSIYEKLQVREPTAPSDDPAIVSWEHFCQSNLSPLSAQAVLRVTNVAREGLVLGS